MGKLLKKKTGMGFGVVFLRGIGCNWLVCMAVFLQTLSNDMSGKYVGIFFPISTFVACGFEHYPANAYALPLALLALQKDAYANPDGPGFGTMLWENLIPCSLGNLFAGVIIMSAGFSFFFGKLKNYPCLQKKEEPTPEQITQAGVTVQANAASPPPAPAPAPEHTQQPAWSKADSGFARTVSC